MRYQGAKKKEKRIKIEEMKKEEKKNSCTIALTQLRRVQFWSILKLMDINHATSDENTHYDTAYLTMILYENRLDSSKIEKKNTLEHSQN